MLCFEMLPFRSPLRAAAAGSSFGNPNSLRERRQLVALPPRPLEESVGFLVAREELLDGVPPEPPAELPRDVAEVRHADGAVADLGVGDGLLPTLDALEP